MTPQPPSCLVELQKWFVGVEVLPFRETGTLRLPRFSPEVVAEIEKRISPGPKLSAAERIGIYNQQYWFRFFAILQNDYPALVRLFGYRDFNYQLVEPFLLQNPPRDWALRKVGSSLPQWLEANYGEEDRDFVLQIAQIEEAYESLARARVLPPPQKIEAATPLFLQPFVSLLDLDADLFTFREQLLAEEPKYWEKSDFPQVAWFEAKRSFALFREEGEIRYEELSASEAALLRAFQRGATLEEACERIEGDAELPLRIADWFQKWAARGWFAS